MCDYFYDDLIKDRVIIVTQFADALVFLVDDGITENNDVIINKALDGKIYDYIIGKYGSYPIVQNTIMSNVDTYRRYINPLFVIGFDVATSREKYNHANNNGLLNIIGVSLDIIANWDKYVEIVLKNLKNAK